MAYKKALMPVSGKSHTKRDALALEQALQIVQEGGEICFLYCVGEVSKRISVDAQKKLVAEAAAKAEELFQPLVERVKSAGFAYNTRIVQGSPARMIPTVASEEACNVVVMYTDGRDTLGKLFTGSVTERVLQTLATPLLIVH